MKTLTEERKLKQGLKAAIWLRASTDEQSTEIIRRQLVELAERRTYPGKEEERRWSSVELLQSILHMTPERR